jgi:hypothetical protein
VTGSLPPRLQRKLEQWVGTQLLGESASLGPARQAIEALGPRLDALEARLPALRQGLDQALTGLRFAPGTTVGQALDLHPGVDAVLAQHGPDRCGHCPVRHDETLEEVAAGHDIALGQLLSSLTALLDTPAER